MKYKHFKQALLFKVGSEVNFLMRCQFGVFEKYKNVCLCRAGRDQ